MKKNPIVFILDDNTQALPMIASSVKCAFNQYGINANIEIFSHAADIQKPCDIFFCDIQMPDADGIQFIESYTKIYPNVTTIFVSNREERVFDSLKVHPFGFVRKANFLQDIVFIVDNYVKEQQKENNQQIESNTIIFEKGTKTYSLRAETIMYIEAKGNYQYIHLINTDPIKVAITINELKEKLQDLGFIQCHKAFLVNCSFIQEIDHDQLKLMDGTIIYISRRKISEVKNAYMHYLSEKNDIYFKSGK